jgi:lipopolysaccharide/colanic/teichoic acid biosynthesis glycosyltransferase
LGRLSRVLLSGGTAGTVVGLGQLHAAWNDYALTGSARFGWAAVYAGALIICAYGVGLPELIPTPRSALGWGLVATGGGAAIISFFQLFLGDSLLPRFVVFASPLILGPWYVACAALSSTGRGRAQRRDRVVVVADGTEATPLQADLVDRPERPARLVDVMKIGDVRDGSGPKPLLDRLERDRGSVLVLSRSAQVEESILSQAAIAHASGIRVRNLISFYEEWLGKLPVSELERTSMMFDISEIHRRQYLRIKRILDVLMALVGFMVLLISLPVVVVGNLIANRGPLLYRQERVGKNGQVFDIVKLRTMRVTPELEALPDRFGDKLATEWTSEHDPRITPFGRLLRKAHLDELPQVINILRGDLSVVGPRPEQPHYVAWLTERMPFFDMRHWVRPGLTGWAQVKNGYAGCEQDTLEKLQYDFYYLRHQSLTLDARIIARSIRSVIGLRGR